MIRWQDGAWDDYIYWQHQDAKMLDKINKIVRDLRRSPFNGIGKPEPLKNRLHGMWSRRIDDANRNLLRDRWRCRDCFMQRAL